MFTLPTGLAAHATQTYNLTLTATSKTGATISAATVSVTRDLNYRNNNITTIHTT